MTEHGGMGDGCWKGARWCSPCGSWHGPLYICEHYDKNLSAMVMAEADQFKAFLNDKTLSDSDKFEHLKAIGIVEAIKNPERGATK